MLKSVFLPSQIFLFFFSLCVYVIFSHAWQYSGSWLVFRRSNLGQSHLLHLFASLSLIFQHFCPQSLSQKSTVWPRNPFCGHKIYLQVKYRPCLSGNAKFANIVSYQNYLLKIQISLSVLYNLTQHSGEKLRIFNRCLI